MRPMRLPKTFFLFLFVLFLPISLQAAVWPISGTATPDTIGSDYGPRNVSDGSTFHYGLDFFVNTVKVKSVTNTTISDIVLASTSETGNYVKTASGFRYLHLSSKTFDYEIRKGYKRRSDGTLISVSYIVFKDSGGKTTKVISSEASITYEYDDDNNPTTANKEEPVASTNTLSEGETFAYSGNSGQTSKGKGYGYHLHIDKGNKGSNPLRDLKDIYTATPSRITILSPSGDEVPAGEVMVEVQVLSGNDFDLNEVKISVENENFNPIFDRPIGPNSDGLKIFPKNNRTGIYPVSNGDDKFVAVFKAEDRCWDYSYYTIKATATDLNGPTVTTSKTVFTLPNPRRPGCSRPDDTFSVNDGFNYEAFAVPDDADEIIDRTPYISKVGMLKQGYYSPWRYLLWRWQDIPAELGTDFSPTIFEKHPVLILPSGSLYGMENSQILKASLAEYVKQGGTLVVFAQQHGYEYSILPTPDGKPITGYGWEEDQNCQWNSSYIDTYHQVLSSLTQTTPSINVDGYFTDYPSGSKVLLRRTLNGQPSMIMYPYGDGYVIATTIYSDSAFEMAQASGEEIALVRDIITWAQKPTTLVEIRPGQSADLSLAITNNKDSMATSMKRIIYNPDRTTMLSEDTVAVDITPGQVIIIPVTYQTTTASQLGIYRIDYTLYDSEGNEIQSERDIERFAVSNPPGNPAQIAQLIFSIQSDSEHYEAGSIANFTIIAFNNSDKDRTVIAAVVIGNYVLFSELMFVPAKGSSSFLYSKYVFSSGRLSVQFYDENRKLLSSATRGYWVYTPSVNVTLQTDKTLYGRGEIVNITANLKNTYNFSYTVTLKTEVRDFKGANIYSQSLSVNLPAGISTQNFNFMLPSTAEFGSYGVLAEVYDTSGKVINRAWTSFKVPNLVLSVTPILPPAFGVNNNISFNIKNSGLLPVSSATLFVYLKDPFGVEIWSGRAQITSLFSGEKTTIDFAMPIANIAFGNYRLSYTIVYEGEVRGSEITIPNIPTIALAFDKSPYRIRETANLTVSLANTGKFNLDPSTGSGVSVTVSVPDAGYSNTETISLRVNPNATILNYVIPIPENITAGQHDVNVTLSLSSGSSIVQSSKLTIPESSLTIGYTGATTLTAGDTITLTIENTGGVDTSYTSEKLTITDNKGVVIYQGNPTGTILAGEKKTLTNIQIPQQTVNGFVFLSVQMKDSKTGKLFYLYKPLEITGLTATLQTRTDKDVYLKTESMTGLSSILNGQFGIEGGSLKVAVSRTKSALQPYQFVNKFGSFGSGNGQFYYPNGVSVDANYIYIADNNRVQIFNKSTYTFVNKFGSYGTGNGQFNRLWGIAVDSDYIYVIDYYNHRVQIFNKSTYAFVGKFGSSGSGNGQFYYPRDIVVDSNYIYVTDTFNHRIQIFNKSTYAFVGKVGSYGSYGSGDGQFIYPQGVAVDSNYIYVTDGYYNYRIQIFNKTSPYAFVGKFGSSGSGNGQFSSPFGIAVDSDYIYVIDYYNHRVQIFNKSTYAFVGKFGSSGSGNGQFTYPLGVAVDANYIYVVDQWNHRVQIFTKDTYAGDSVEKLFETTRPVTQSANISQDYITNIGTLNATGKLYLNAELKNALGQTIATAEYPFYIIDGNTLLLFSTDKKVYKPGETVNITGEIKNLASIAASGLTLSLNSQLSTQNPQLIYNSTFDLPANGSYPFTVTTTAATEGMYTLTGKVTQNNSTLVEIADSYEVANPKVSVTVTAPDVAGNEPFTINVEMKNEGKVNTSIQYIVDSRQGNAGNTIDNQQITIPAGETKVIQYQQQITNNTTYTFTFTGDLEQTISKTIEYGLSASVSVGVSDGVYPEGKVAIPVTITNTGLLDENVEVSYQLSTFNSQLLTSTKTYYIPKAGSVADTLYYDLTEGSYQLSAISIQPSATASANFSVRKENKVEMTVAVGAQTNELIPVTVNLTNIGYNEISGSVSVSVSGQNTAVWNGSQNVSQLSTLNFQLLTFNINSSAIAPDDYALKVELLNNSNQQIAVSSQPITIKGSVFQITQLPSYQTFTVGQEAAFAFKVKNTGNQEGAFDLNLKAYDLIDSTQREWLKPGEEKEMNFSFMLPEDLEEKDYFADYESGTVPTKGQVKYHVAGINLNVNASLDKQYYSEGETARLTISVSTLNSQLLTLNLFARANYNGYENQKSFTLTSTSILTFDIPLTQITGEKLFYGIYHESGRSIHLNSLYIYKAGDVITITTDKQVYNPGETVSVTVNSVSGTTGTLTLTAPNYEEAFNFSGTTTKSFTLPSTMTAGTYNISAQLSTLNSELITASHPFDVNGIQVKVLECKNDKGKYASTDTISTGFTISSNTNMPAVLKAWIVDPEGKYTSAGENSINLLSSEPLLFTDHYSLSTALSGIHRLVYGVYSGDLLLVSGSEAFDVGDAVLLGLATDKTDYPENTAPVSVTVSMFGTVDASLELQLDGTTVKNESVALNGFTTLNLELGTVKPGTHIFKGILTAGGLKSTKETSFVYGSNLPDLTAGLRTQSTEPRKDNTIQITTTIANQGKTTSDATTISIYDGDPSTSSGLIETKTVNALNSGESQEITFTWNVLGKAGEHTIKAVVDPDNTVTEFNEENNTAQLNIVIPDITLITETEKETYKIRQKVNITSTITNLTSAKTYQNLRITTSAKDPSGNEVYQSSTLINTIEPLNTITHEETWNTSGLPVDGIYTLTQTLASGSLLIAQSSKLIALQKAPDFTIAVSSDYQKIKQGESATYTASLEAVNGWTSEITLSMEGLPAGTSVSFDPGNLIPPGEVLTVIITTNATTTGTYNLNLVAQGTDEGEVVTHSVPLTLDISGFGLEAVSSSQTIKQLEIATFEINVNSLNGYEGEINLNIEGVPNGVKATFDNTKIQTSGNVKLTVQTSKYARPSTYTFTITGDDGLVKHTLDLSLILNLNPDIAAGIITAQGPGPNNTAEIKVFNSNLQTVLDIAAFDTKYGAYVIGADIDGDGYDEIIVSEGPDPKNTATLRVFKRNGTFIAEHTAFETNYGLTLSSGDIDGDWKDELIVGMGPDPKNPATMKILKYNGAGFTELMTQTVFDTKYGLNTAIGDIDGDGISEIITAAGSGPNNPATIKVWKYENGSLSELSTITAFEGNYGTNIAAGDIDGDGKAEIIIGTGPDPKNPAIVRAYKAGGTLIMELRPYDAEYGYGVTIAAGDINGDGIDEIITGLGPGPQNLSWVKVFRYDGSEIYSFISYPDSVKYGVKVSKGNIGD